MNGHGTVVDSKRVKLSSIYSDLEAVPPDAIFNVLTRFLADKSLDKVDLGIGGEVPSTLDLVAAKHVFTTNYVRFEYVVHPLNGLLNSVMMTSKHR